MPRTKRQPAIASPAFVPLPGSQRHLLPDSRPSGSIDPDEIVHLTIRVRSRGDVGALEDAVREMSTRPLAEREYMTHEQLAATHGSDSDDLDAVESYARKNHLLVQHRSTGARSLVVSGRLGDALAAFHADIHVYSHSSGPYRGRQGEILIPRELDGIITGIFGFDTRPKHKTPHRQRIAHAKRRTSASPLVVGPNGVPATTFAKRYNFPTTFGGKKLDGSGQCIAIIELGGGFDNSDLQLYFQKIHVSQPNVVAISVDGAGNRPTRTGDSDGEVMLDIEVAAAVAPKAKIAVYFAPNRGNGFLDAISMAVHDTERKPSVVSISWGGPEEGEEQAVKAFHEVFVAAAALGVTICAASGDHGTADLDGNQWDGKIHVDHPASDDFVLGCGGTQIDASGKDVVWNDGTALKDPDGGGWATGGGISTIFPVPAYQKKANTTLSLVSHKHGRGVPDIAMSATDYFVRVHSLDQPSGGTSAVAPLMSALVALLNQAKKKNVGFLNPFLYNNAAKGVVTPVTSGTNAIAKTVKGYKAKNGWSACTGLGIPNGKTILANL